MNTPTVFHWDQNALTQPLAAVRHRQGRLIGRMQTLGFSLREEAVLHTLTEDVLKSSEIEGEILDKDQVRSSIARRLGMEMVGLAPADRNVDGVVEMMLDATQKYKERLTADRLFGWHAALFPTGRSGMQKITVGAWRDDKTGRMQVVSNPYGGHETVHYEAPPAKDLDEEMKSFLAWFNTDDNGDPVIRAAIAHLWFVTVR
jgi:Fic family protein